MNIIINSLNIGGNKYEHIQIIYKETRFFRINEIFCISRTTNSQTTTSTPSDLESIRNIIIEAAKEDEIYLNNIQHQLLNSSFTEASSRISWTIFDFRIFRLSEF